MRWNARLQFAVAFAAAGLAGALALLPAPAGPQGSGSNAGPHGMRGIVHAQSGARRSACAVRVGKTAAPTTVTLGAEATVMLTSTTTCPPQLVPMRIVLSIDGSNSMIPQGKLEAAKDAATQFARKVDYTHSRVGVTSFSDKAYLETDLTDREGRVVGAIQGIDTEFGTVIGAGLRLSADRISRARRDGDPNLPPLEAIVILSDGRPYPESAAEVRAAANSAKGQGILIISICVGSDCDQALMRSIASRASLYFDVRSAGRLVSVFNDIIEDLLDTQLRRIDIRDVLPANMRYVPDSAAPSVDAVEPDPVGGGEVLTWRWSVVPKDGLTITYRVQPQAVGVWPTNVEARAVFRDTKNMIGEVVFPIPTIHVVAPIPTATATDTPPPTATATETPAASATATPQPPPTATLPPSATPTAALRPLFLPLALREQCDPRTIPADVVLVIDVSTSMDAPTAPGGPTKRAAAVAAARAFVAAAAPRGDQVGVVTFADVATLVAPLGTPSDVVDRHLGALPHASGTDLAAGLRLALAEVIGPAHVAERPAALIVLTDGRPTRSTPAAAVEAAQAAAAVGVAVYAVGVGADVQAELLRAIAGADDRFVIAPQADALERIFRGLAAVVPCPAAGLWTAGPPAVRRASE